MLKLVLYNSYAQLEGQISPIWEEKKAFNDELRKVLSYQVPNVEYSPKYKEDKWDGLISLYNWSTQSFPTGCVQRVLDFLREKGIKCKFEDGRKKPKRTVDIDTRFSEYGRSLYFYQEKAVEEAVAKGRGIISLATGGGKTMLSCEILARIGVAPIVFYVPSRSLLRQTHNELTKYLAIDGHAPHIGFIGDSIVDINPKGINIMTYHTALAAFNESYNQSKDQVVNNNLAGERIKKTTEQLQKEKGVAQIAYNEALMEAEEKFDHLKKSPKPKDFDRAIKKELKPFKKALDKAKIALENRMNSIRNKKQIRMLIKNAAGMIVDECHAAAVIIETLGKHAPNAYYRIGLSATPFREDNQEIRIEGTMGRKIIEITCSDLIDLGFLVPPRIFQIEVNNGPAASCSSGRYRRKTASESYADKYKKYITYSWERNYRIKQFAEGFKEFGRPVLILVETIEHGQILESMIKDSIFVAGGDRGNDDPDAAERDYRRRMLNECEANNIILIATQWAYVGVDAPAISTLILAGSTCSAISTYQMVGRVLRRSPETGKTEAVIIDFMDKEDKLHTHSLVRRRIYRSERSWQYKRIKLVEDVNEC